MNLQFLKPLKDIPQNRFEQSEGAFSKDKPCCFGSHLAQVLLNETGYKKGRAEFMRRLNINKAEMILLFKESGLKTNDPFSNVAWNLPVKTVIENMEKIKKIPSTKGANLSSAYLEGANLEGDNLYKAKLVEAYLEGANLEEANLYKAKLYKAKLEGANLKGANLEFANLNWSNLEEANLEEANLEGATLERANLYKANLEGANLVEANLYKAYLEEANLKDCKFPKKYEHLLSKEQKEQVIWVA